MESNHTSAPIMTTTSTNSPHQTASTRLSTFSITAPTLAPSIAPSHLSAGADSLSPSEKASNSADDGTMQSVREALLRLEEPRLSNQRYVVSEGKRDEIGALALMAKLERALDRRMSGQDASFTKLESEKQSPSGVKVKGVSPESLAAPC